MTTQLKAACEDFNLQSTSILHDSNTLVFKSQGKDFLRILQLNSCPLCVELNLCQHFSSAIRYFQVVPRALFASGLTVMGWASDNGPTNLQSVLQGQDTLMYWLEGSFLWCIFWFCCDFINGH